MIKFFLAQQDTYILLQKNDDEQHPRSADQLQLPRFKQPHTDGMYCLI